MKKHMLPSDGETRPLSSPFKPRVHQDSHGPTRPAEPYFFAQEKTNWHLMGKDIYLFQHIKDKNKTRLGEMVSLQGSYLIDLFGIHMPCCCMLIASHFEAESAWITTDLRPWNWPGQLGRAVYMNSLVLPGLGREDFFGEGRTTSLKLQG